MTIDLGQGLDSQRDFPEKSDYVIRPNDSSVPLFVLDFVNTRRFYKLFINMIKLPTNVFKAPGQRVEHILLYGGGPILIARDFADG